MVSFDVDRYDRQLIMPEIGFQGQERLVKARALVIGAGGLGCPAALFLAAAGLGTIGIADSDTVSISNLNRQILHGMKDLSRNKVISAKESLLEMNPSIKVNTYNIAVDKSNIMDLVSGYDVVIDAVDNFAARFLVNDACFFAGKPLVEAGATAWYGQIATIIPGKGPCLRCIIDAPFSSAGSLDTRQNGVLGTIPGIIGTLQALETIKIVTGIGPSLSGRLLAFDGLKCRFREIKTARRNNCPLCGMNPKITGIAGSDTV